MRPAVISICLVLLFGLLSGCTQAPPLPHFSPPDAAGPDSLIFRESISARDIREIFRAINRDGKLDSLKRLIEEASDEKLESVGAILSRYLYKDALNEDGLASLLESHIQSQSFSSLRALIRKWRAQSTFPLEAETLRDLLSSKQFPEILSRDSGALDPDWLESVARAFERTGSEYRETLPWPKPESIPTSAWLGDLRHFLSLPNAHSRVTELSELFDKEDFGTTLLKALSGLRERAQVPAFEGFGHGLGALLTTPSSKTDWKKPNELDLLARFARNLDSPSNGLFEVLEENLRKHPDTVRELAFLLRPGFVSSVADIMRETVLAPQDGPLPQGKKYWFGISSEKGQPNQSFSDLFSVLREGIDRATKPIELSEAGSFPERLPVYLNAYALTKWVEAVVSEERDSEEWKSAAETDFLRRLWQLPLRSKTATGGFRLQMLEEITPGRFRLSERTKQELTALGLGEFAQTLSGVVALPGSGGEFGSFLYDFRPVAPGTSLQDAFQAAVARCDAIRSFANLSAFFQVFAHGLTQPGGSPFELKSLETPNLLDDVHRLLATVSLGNLRATERLLFDSAKIGHLEAATRNLILGLFDSRPDLVRRVTFLLDSVQVVHEFDRPVRGLPSPFELYHELLRLSRSGEIHSTAAMMSFLSDADFFETSENFSKAQYPAIYQWVKNGSGVGELLYGLSLIDPEDRVPLLRNVRDAFGTTSTGNGLSLHLQLADGLISRHSDGLLALIDRARGFSFPKFPLEHLTELDLRWISRFGRSGGYSSLSDFLNGRSSKAQMLSFVRELKALSESGYLREALSILPLFRDDHIRRVGEVLILWDRSGELREFLSALEDLLN